jgi:Domain of unknown function (DUF1707)
VTPAGIWREFEHDPRDPSYAGMRASDRDRGVVHDLLASAYAEGRLDREELDERTAAVTAAKTYAELLPPIRDLAAEAVPADLVLVAPGDVRRSAEVHYAGVRREALFGFLVPNLICWAIWYLTGHDYFAWPIFVSIPTALNLLRVLSSRQEIIEKRVEKLQRRQAKELEAPEPTASGPILGHAEETERPPVDEPDED